MKQIKKYLFIFDFDKTIVDLDTDRYILRSLPEQKLPQSLIEQSTQADWNLFMKEVLIHINAQGVNISAMQECIRSMEITKGYDKLFELIKQYQNIEAVIVSDSNSFFIDTLLDHWKVEELFKNIFTNPGRQDSLTQLVSISPYHAHTCEKQQCPSNLCKRLAILGHWETVDQLQDRYDKIYYFGDGENDYCPLELLREQDVVFARKDYALDKLINKKPVKCQVFSWVDGHQIIDSQHFMDFAETLKHDL